MDEKKCYFCETAESVNCSLYIFEKIDGKRVPVQVPVCKKCKDEYEATFPKH